MALISRGLGVTIPPMIWRAVVGVLAVAAAFVPIPASVVERVYSLGVFPLLQPRLTALSNLTPWALFDVLLVGVVGWLLVATFRDFRVSRAERVRAVVRVLVRFGTTAAAAYLVFLATWGLNYRRAPLVSGLDFDASRISPESALVLASTTVERLNVLYAPAHAERWPQSMAIDAGLAAAFVQAQRDLGSRTPFLPGRPKRTLLDLYFQRAGVAGMTDPYFLETLVATDLLPIERPMVVAHEWSHLAGIADEGAANFSGWLTCLRGSAFHQYSGWLFLYGETARALAPEDARGIAAGLSDGPRADLQAVRDRLLGHLSPTVSRVGWRVYDKYLKANRVDAGTASYEEVVRLVLGTDFAPDWVPRLR